MKTYTYFIGKRKKTPVQVDKELFEELQRMDYIERNSNIRYRKHNIPLSKFDVEEDERFIDPRGDAYDELVRKIESERVQAALATLSESELLLVEKCFIDWHSEKFIAVSEGIPFKEVQNKIKRLKKKLQKLLA